MPSSFGSQLIGNKRSKAGFPVMDRMMENFAEWKSILLNDLHVLKQLRGLDEMSLMRYGMKEQDISLHCYQAEESLTDAELALLKKELRLSELQWRVYKSKLRPGSA